jgi:hypothetical protein
MAALLMACGAFTQRLSPYSVRLDGRPCTGYIGMYNLIDIRWQI